MSLTITVPDDLAVAVEQTAKLCGTSSEKLLIDTIRNRFAPSGRKTASYLQKGKYVAGAESTEDDFLIAEWNGNGIGRG